MNPISILQTTDLAAGANPRVGVDVHYAKAAIENRREAELRIDAPNVEDAGQFSGGEAAFQELAYAAAHETIEALHRNHTDFFEAHDSIE